MAMPPLTLETKPNSYLWRVAAPYVVIIRGCHVEIPVGFLTDLASVPRLFQNVLPSDGKYKECAVVHDFLLSSGRLKRSECDKMFYFAMIDNGITPLTAYVMYKAVSFYTKVKRL
jgi:hypothetical protein